MKKYISLLILALFFSIKGFAQFSSATDVLTYLDGKTFTKASVGASLSFREVGSQLSLNGKLMFYQPSIRILSRNKALVNYIGITDPSLKAGLIVDNSSNTIEDRSNGSVYRYDPTKGSFPDLSNFQGKQLPKITKRTNYKITKTNDNIYLISDISSNSPFLYIAPDDKIVYPRQKKLINYEEAQEICDGLKIGDKDSWRLPTYSELEIIFGLQRELRLSDPENSLFWTTTKSEVSYESDKYYKCVNFLNGEYDNYFYGKDIGRVIAVSDINPKIKPDLSQQNTDIFIDSRDGHKYKTIKIGNQTWMAENFAYLPECNSLSQVSTSTPCYYIYKYNGNNVDIAKQNSNYIKFGVLYNWEAAKSSCPEGWHIPSVEEFQILVNFLRSNGYGNGLNKMYVSKALSSQSDWAPPYDKHDITCPGSNLKTNNKSGFDAKPGGYSFVSGSEVFFQNQSEGINFWTSTFDEEGLKQFYLGLNQGNPDFLARLKDVGTYVRYIKDDPSSTKSSLQSTPTSSHVEGLTPTNTDKTQLIAKEMFDKGYSQYSNKDFSNALQNFNESIRLDPRSSSPYFFAALCLDNLKRTREAIDLLNKCVEIESVGKKENTARALEYRGTFKFNLDNTDITACDDLRKACEMGSKGACDAYNSVKEILCSNHSGSISEETNDEKLKRDPDPRKDYANVFYKPQYTLFDHLTDEPIFPDSNGVYTIYIASNEMKKPQKLVGTGDRLSQVYMYKFKNLENCQKWCEQ